jgi:hypothetical protein
LRKTGRPRTAIREFLCCLAARDSGLCAFREDANSSVTLTIYRASFGIAEPHAQRESRERIRRKEFQNRAAIAMI